MSHDHDQGRVNLFAVQCSLFMSQLVQCGIPSCACSMYACNQFSMCVQLYLMYAIDLEAGKRSKTSPSRESGKSRNSCIDEVRVFKFNADSMRECDVTTYVQATAVLYSARWGVAWRAL
eukprot:7058695-Prymnesium_polylepis.1